MEKTKRRVLNLVILARFKLMTFVLILISVCLFVNAYASIKFIQARGVIFGGEMAFVIFHITFTIAIFAFMIMLALLLHHGFGALSRMERILEEIINGDYSKRLYLRERDIMRPFAERLNKLLDLFEGKHESSQ